MERSKLHKKKEQAKSLRHLLGNIIGALFCVILIPVLIINVTLIVKSLTDDSTVPGIGGYFPMIVLSDSMYPLIEGGDLIICKTVDADVVQEGDVIAFFDPAGNGTTVVTHRVTEVITSDGALSFRTQGDANNAADALAVPAESVLGKYCLRIPNLGNVAMFMQTTAGLIVCVLCPLALLILYDVLRRRRYEARHKADTEALMAELQSLRGQLEATPQKGDNAQDAAQSNKDAAEET